MQIVTAKMTENRIREIEEKWPQTKGKALYLKHLKGCELTRSEAITAHCYSCGGGENEPCGVASCVLYPYSHLNASQDVKYTAETPSRAPLSN